MVQSIQGRQQEFYRSVTSATSGTWEENAIDAWEAMGVSIENNFNGSYRNYLMSILGDSTSSLTGLIAAYEAAIGDNYPDGALLLIGSSSQFNQIAFARNSSATYFDEDGVLQEAAINELRDSAYFPDSSLPTKEGLLVEHEATKYIRNSTMDGGSAPSTLPTYWSVNDNTGASILYDYGEVEGKKYIDWIVSGSAANGFLLLKTESNTQIPASDGETWTFSAELALEDGSFEDITQINMTFQKYDSGGGFLGTTVAPNFRIDISENLAKFETVATLDEATVAYIVPMVRIITTGGILDCTLRVANPKAQKGSSTSFTPSTDSAVTSAADNLQIEDINNKSWFSASQGTVYMEVYNAVDLTKYPDAANGGDSFFFELGTGDTSTDERIILRKGTIVNELNGLFRTGGADVADLSLSWGTQDELKKVAISWKEDNFNIALNGTAATADTGGSVPSVTHLRIGNASNTTEFATYISHGTLIYKMVYCRFWINDERLEAITS